MRNPGSPSRAPRSYPQPLTDRNSQPGQVVLTGPVSLSIRRHLEDPKEARPLHCGSSTGCRIKKEGQQHIAEVLELEPAVSLN